MKKIIIAILCITIIILIMIVFNINRSSKSEAPIDDIYDEEKIEEVKNEIDATGDNDIYQVYEEYDGRKIVQVKPEIQYDTVLAGIIKNDIPQENEISTLLEKKPTKNGVWISEQSRKKFIELLNNNNINEFSINEEGYLTTSENKDNENFKKLKNAINDEKLIIIDCQGKTYTRDDMTGEIIEYPFEKMDPYQAVDIYLKDNKRIIEVTTNESGKLTNEDILTDLLLNLES